MRQRFLAVILAAALAATLGGGAALAQADSCRWANDNECDEPRYGGTGACENGTDATDCRAEADAMARLIAAIPPDIRARLGGDTCRWAYDRECDDAQFDGTGACAAGTDLTDCRALAIGGDDSCRWANDGECDEPGIGTGACTDGTDATDCRGLGWLRNRTNACEYAFNGICDEPASASAAGTGRCPARSDTADCAGRQRPPGARDHFFGEDQRILIRATGLPWSATGLLALPDGSCTGILIGPNLVATAAHCLVGEAGAPLKATTFRAGAWGDTQLGQAIVIGQTVSPDYTPQARPAGQGNGNDWAIVTLDRDLGAEVGFVRPYVLDKADLARIARGEEYRLSQAGYSWDTGSWLSGHMDCRIVTALPDGSILHTCDTTRGDSGSPLLMQVGGEWRLIAVDSQFFDPQPPFPEFSSAHLAVDTRAFQAALRAAGAID
jgi:protease YdgD